MKHNQMNRRHFFQTIASSAIVLGSLSFLGLNVSAQEKRSKKAPGAATGGTPACNPAEGMAKNINYHTKHADVKDAKLKVEKNGVPFEKQFCSGCQFYDKLDEKVGKCQLIQNCTVEANGWSSSWAKKV